MSLETPAFPNSLDPVAPPLAIPSPSTARATRRVLHIINGEFYAGAERVQDLLAQRLPEFGFDVGFAALRPRAFNSARRAQQAPLYDATMRHKFDLRPARALAQIVRDEKYELIHTHTARSALIGRAVSQLTGVPLVHHVHSPAARETTNRWSNRANAWLEHYVLPHAKAFIAVSSSLGRYARQMGLPHERVVVVPNGVPTPGPLASRAKPVTPWTLGSVALFRPRKGLEVLIDAMGLLCEQGHDVRLRAVGTFESPEYQREILARVERLNLGSQIEWRGFQSNVYAELAEMDLFVLPSLFGEGMPMVVLEAMAAGVPVVSTRVEGVPEAIREGVDGLLADAADPVSLAGAIEQFVTGAVDWSTMRSEAYERQVQCFSDRSMAENVAQVYDAVLDGRPAVHAVAHRNFRPSVAPGHLEPHAYDVLGVTITDLPFDDAVAVAQAMLDAPATQPHVINFANAHTLNCAASVAGYREVLNRSDLVYGDGTGVRWAAKLNGTRLRANLNGTDLVPALFDAAAGLGYRYYLLGSDSDTIQTTAEVMRRRFPSWTLSGFHHGYLSP
ncbi:MAG: glycosyltransferase, partial [Planctomycetaceae bacterium]|nr:glycosyltransferase [Planctomycetaceae bacterium]